MTGGGLVLLYHRVTQLPTDPQLLAVSPERFAEQLEVLRSTMRPLRLGEMVDAAAANRLPDRAVAVTFDDGYADNLLEAEPLLRRFGVPSTVFATTGRTDGTDEFFWDELDRLLLQPSKLPPQLTIALGGPTRTSDLSGCALYTPDQWAIDRTWNVTQPARPGSRQQLYLDLCGTIHRLTADARSAGLVDLRRWAGVDRPGRPSHRMMTSAELRALDAGGVVDVGAHTVEHPLLSAETPDRQAAEVRGSCQALADLLGRPVTTFSYPFGGRRDYTAQTVSAVRAAGGTLACSNFAGRVRAETDRYQLPRFIVRDWDGPRFARELDAWLARP